MEEVLLKAINSPEDLRKIPVEKLPELCEEIRMFLIRHLSVNPGHFASSMGAVDLIVALHYVFNTPDDRLVWDVGHQAYTHKLLTGRQKEFATQRTLGGISGFPSPLESSSDTFMAGHASNSISAALGMAIADKSNPTTANRKTVAIIGDASISGGLAFEGLNNAANQPNDLLIVLNDNEMSIDANVGALHKYLSAINTSSKYNKLRERLYHLFKKKGLISDRGKGRIIRFNNSVKALISRQQNIFEGLNIRYFGPFDGHNVIELVRILREIKDMRGPRLLHLHTVKGKGFPEAENNPAAWHAPGKFDPATGSKVGSFPDKPGGKKWQDIFGDYLLELAENRSDIVGVTAAMPSGTSIATLMKKYPERAFDVGISEGHAVTFAGGLAVGGKHPFVAIYSSFLQRAYDNIINDVSIQGLPVTFCIDRAGIVGEDGVTHHGIFDLAYLRAIPNMIVAAPMDANSLRELMRIAADTPSPMSIRYPRGNSPLESSESENKPETISYGKGRIISGDEDAQIAVLTIGDSGNEAVKAIKALQAEGIKVAHYDMVFLKPLDKELLKKIATKYQYVITVEDGILTGGLGSAVAEYFTMLPTSPKQISLGITDHWVSHGSVDELRRIEGIDSLAIRKVVKKAYSILTGTNNSDVNR